MAPALREAGARRLVATTHGHEAGWAQLPGSRQLLRRIGEGTDTITYLGEYTRSRIAAALTPEAAAAAWCNCRPASTRRPSTPARAATRCAPGSASPTARWSSASPGWCRARARTP